MTFFPESALENRAPVDVAHAPTKYKLERPGRVLSSPLPSKLAVIFPK